MDLSMHSIKSVENDDKPSLVYFIGPSGTILCDYPNTGILSTSGFSNSVASTTGICVSNSTNLYYNCAASVLCANSSATYNHLEMNKMSEERNQYNFYNHLEDIKKSLDWLQTIHVYEVNNRAYASPENVKKLEDQVALLDKQVLEYEIQVKDLDDELEELQASYKSLTTDFNTVAAENGILKSKLRITESENGLLKSIDETVLKNAEAYNKLPKFIRKFYK